MYEGKSSWKIPFCYKNYAVNYLKNTDFSHFIIVLCVYNSKSCKNRLKFGGMIIFKKMSQNASFPTTSKYVKPTRLREPHH